MLDDLMLLWIPCDCFCERPCSRSVGAAYHVYNHVTRIRIIVSHRMLTMASILIIPSTVYRICPEPIPLPGSGCEAGKSISHVSIYEKRTRRKAEEGSLYTEVGGNSEWIPPTY